MSLIQPLKFRTLKMGCFKMPHLQTAYLQMAFFEMVVIVASGHNQNLFCHQMFTESLSRLMAVPTLVPGSNNWIWVTVIKNQ